jgi:aminoglycoside phosphotransferase (APT) family kinase protein
MRGTFLIAALAVALACVLGAASAATAATSAETELTITYWANGASEGSARTWTLRCDPVGGTLGTLARERAACGRLDALRAPFARPNPTMVCTMQYGGPDQAQITGTYEGRRVWVRLGLADGCQIARFKRFAFLIPAYS